MDHVPPKQFYPKSVRIEEDLNLWVVPTHKRCNGEYKKDEEYFYHSLCLLVANTNPRMGSVVFKDIERRAKNPQSRTLIRGVVKTASNKTKGGLFLPDGVASFRVNKPRIERVAIKIAQGLFFRENSRFLPWDNCKDIRLCHTDENVPEMYRLSWQATERVAVCPSVFSYWSAFLNGMHYFSLLFWEGFMICILFDEPIESSSTNG